MAQDRLPAREPDVASSRHQVPGAADPGQRAGDPHAGTGPSARGRHDIVEAEHTSFFWPEVDDLLTYEFSADLMDQIHAGLQSPTPADAPPPPPGPSIPPAASVPLPPGPGELTMPAPSGAQPPPLSGPNPFLPGAADQPTVVAPDPGATQPVAAAPGAVPSVPDLKLSSPVPTDADPTIRTSELSGDAGSRAAASPPPPAGPPGGGGYVPDVVAGSFGAEMPPPPPGDDAGGLDGLRGSRLFDPRPEPPDPGGGRLTLGNLFEPTDPGAPPQTRRLVRLAGRQSPDEVDVTSARLVSPFDSSGPSVRSLFPASARDGDRPGRSSFDDDDNDGFGPGAATSEMRMGSPAPFGPDAGPHRPLLDGGPPVPPVSLSHSTVVDPASGPPVGASFLAPAPSDAWNSSNPAWTSVSDTVSDLPPRQGQGFLYLEEDQSSWAGPPLMRQAEPAARDKGAMLDSVLDVLDRKRGALLAGALALTAVLGGLLVYGQLTDGDGTEASGAFTASTNTTSATSASSVGSGTGQSGSGAPSVSVAGPTTLLSTQTSEAPSSAVTAASTSTTRRRATTSASTTASTAAPTDPPTSSTTQPPSSPTTQPPTSPSTTRLPTTTTRPATTTTRATTTTSRPTTTTTASTTSTTASTTTTTESTTTTTSTTSATDLATP